MEAPIDYGPVTRTVVEDDLIALCRKARECAEDLQSELAARYGEHVTSYPSQLRRFQRDMQIVDEVKALADRLEPRKS